LATQNRKTFEVEAKAISAFTGWAIKPENISKLFVEVKEHFVWGDGNTIPLIGLKLLSSLSPDRAQLGQLVAAFSEVAQTRGELSLSNAQIRFMGAVPNQTPEQLKSAILKHCQMARKTVFGNLLYPRLVLEIDSEKPSQLGKKIIRTISETAREQFSRSNPGVIWTHIELISEKDFTLFSSPHNGQAGFFDRIASAALLSEKRSHLGQLVFSGGCAPLTRRPYITHPPAVLARASSSPADVARLCQKEGSPRCSR
jgi:hypothetical protein